MSNLLSNEILTPELAAKLDELPDIEIDNIQRRTDAWYYYATKHHTRKYLPEIMKYQRALVSGEMKDISMITYNILHEHPTLYDYKSGIFRDDIVGKCICTERCLYKGKCTYTEECDFRGPKDISDDLTFKYKHASIDFWRAIITQNAYCAVFAPQDIQETEEIIELAGTAPLQLHNFTSRPDYVADAICSQLTNRSPELVSVLNGISSNICIDSILYQNRADILNGKSRALYEAINFDIDFSETPNEYGLFNVVEQYELQEYMSDDHRWIYNYVATYITNDGNDAFPETTLANFIDLPLLDHQLLHETYDESVENANEFVEKILPECDIYDKQKVQERLSQMWYDIDEYQAKRYDKLIIEHVAEFLRHKKTRKKGLRFDIL